MFDYSLNSDDGDDLIEFCIERALGSNGSSIYSAENNGNIPSKIEARVEPMSQTCHKRVNKEQRQRNPL